MALTVTYMEGFDLDIVPPGMTNEGAGTQSFGPGRVGRAIGLRGSADGSLFGVVQLLPAAQGSGAMAFAYGVQPLANQSYFAALREGATVHLMLKRLEDNTVVLLRGDGTQLGAASPVLAWTGWNHFEISYTIDDAAGAATLYVNSEKVVDLSGIDTRNGGTVGTVDRFSFHKQSGFINNPDSYVDDVVVGSTRDRIGDCKIETLIPNANGVENTWTGSDGDSVNNWDLVNDTSATDYNETKTTGARDIYNLTDPQPQYGDVLAVQVQAQVFKSADGAPNGTLKSVLRDAAGTEVKDPLISNAVLSTSPAWVMGPVRQTAPAGGAWDLTKLTALQAGVELG